MSSKKIERASRANPYKPALLVLKHEARPLSGAAHWGRSVNKRMRTAIQVALAIIALSQGGAGEVIEISPERAARSIKDVPLGNATLITKLHLLPSFRTPVYLEEYSGPVGSRVTAFRVDDTAEAPKVEVSFDLLLSEQNNSKNANMANLPGFLALPEKEEINPLYESTDGETYILEMKDKTGYHRVIRRNPSSFSTERNLLYFDSLCKEILERAGILPRPKSLTE